MENHRKSLVKRARTHGFRVRQRTRSGREIHSRRRRVRRSCNIAQSLK
ncbi:MAG: 50S ribosomal protein L34 [Sedimentisphaerales bacterium]|nr:50S ribosomal protein L34 [Sedimentisphaerales bacterium]